MSLHLVEAKDVRYDYFDGTHALCGVSFRITHGESVAIVGANGAGKSTLLQHLSGCLLPGVGTVQVGDTILTRKTLPIIRRTVGMVFQDPDDQLFMPTVFADVAFGPINLGLPADQVRSCVERALDTVGIRHLAARPVSEISGGELQLVLIARALAQQPAVMILDEPTSHLDFGNQVRVLRLIERLVGNGIAVVMSSHFPDHSFIIPQRVAIMKDRRFIAVGDAEEVVTPTFLRQAYGIDVTVTHVEEVGRRICVPSATSGRH